jgi:hypothetical protein
VPCGRSWSARYTGRQVWNRQRTDLDLVDPANTGLGHKQVQRWNLPEGWVISRQPAHPALVSETDFITARDIAATCGPPGATARRSGAVRDQYQPSRNHSGQRDSSAKDRG